MGSGIEEEYAGALAAIVDLRRALGVRPLTNDTPDGRVLLEVAWIEQEIKRQPYPARIAAAGCARDRPAGQGVALAGGAGGQAALSSQRR